MDKFRISQRAVFGVLVIFVGIIMLLNGLKIIDADISFRMYWPMILILFGLAKIINYDESTFFGGVILLIGAYFQLKNFNVPFIKNVHLAAVFWPVIIILFGLSMIFQPKVANRRDEDNEAYNKDKSNENIF